jgi:ATP-binding cassette subfamily F protein 3
MIVTISHEKQLSNSICNYIIRLSDKKLQLFRGNCDPSIDMCKKKASSLVKNITTQKREHMQHFIDKFGTIATKAKWAQSGIKVLEKMTMPKKPNEKDSDPIMPYTTLPS